MKSSVLSKLFSYLIFFIIIIISASVYSLLIYYDKLSSSSSNFNTYTFIIGIFCFIILGFSVGHRAMKNGLLEGLIAALIIILITLIINFFVHVPFVTKSFVKIASYLTASSLGGIIGVNVKPITRKKVK